MQRNEVVVLPVVPSYKGDLWSLLAPLARGKTVLNVGAAGNVEYYLDAESVAYANARGEGLLVGNCETVELARKFDLVVFSEVIEHVNAPAAALENLLRHMNPEGKLFITTPNPNYYGTLLRALLGCSLSVYYNHVMAYFPENLVALCQRLGFRISAIHFFNTMDKRSAGLRSKSWIARQVGRIILCLASNFIVIVEAP